MVHFHVNKKKRGPKPKGGTPVTPKKTGAEGAKNVSPVLKIDGTTEVNCGVCIKPIKEDEDGKFMACNHCGEWFHLGCTTLDAKTFDFLHTINDKHSKCLSIKWFCKKCPHDEVAPGADDDVVRSALQDKKIDKLSSMVLDMQKKMDSVLSQVGTEQKVEEKIGVQLSEALNDQRELDEKKYNLMIFNLPEGKDKEEDLERTKGLLNYVNSEEVVDYLTTTSISRLGRFSEGNPRPRPIKLVFNDPDTRWKFIKKASRLGSSDEFKRVGLSFDKTTKERREDLALRAKLKEEREARPGDDLVIFRNKIVKRVDIPDIKKASRDQAIADPNVAAGAGAGI